MDDGFECSCPSEYKGPTCESKYYDINVRDQTNYNLLFLVLPIFGHRERLIVEKEVT